MASPFMLAHIQVNAETRVVSNQSCYTDSSNQEERYQHAAQRYGEPLGHGGQKERRLCSIQYMPPIYKAIIILNQLGEGNPKAIMPTKTTVNNNPNKLEHKTLLKRKLTVGMDSRNQVSSTKPYLLEYKRKNMHKSSSHES